MATRTLQSSGVQFDDRRRFYLSPQVTKELWPSVTPFTTTIANTNTIGPESMMDTVYKMLTLAS